MLDRVQFVSDARRGRGVARSARRSLEPAQRQHAARLVRQRRLELALRIGVAREAEEQLA
jgi:hypothetical protein